MQRRSAIQPDPGENCGFAPEVLGQQTFQRMLYLERRRTERTGRRFVLLLLQSGTVDPRPARERLLYQVARTVLASTRETDITGWYESGTVLGSILTEIGSTDGKIVTAAVLKRITDRLEGILTPDQIRDIHVTYRVFPDELLEHQGLEGPPDMTLYPEEMAAGKRNPGSRLVKRILDIFGSLLALALFSPVLLAIACIVKLTSKGPVFFRQQRVGQFGTRFTFLKFRSMHVSNDDAIHREYVKKLISNNASTETGATGPVFKLRNDPRVTKIGRFLRRTSLDELPQLLNVLSGEMSLVGPRPPVPYEYACYNAWHRRRLLTVKPGITGLWQVKGRSRVSFDEMVRLDLRYADGWSVWLDLKILCLTPLAVISGDGAY